ncbi:SMI1/KNR4 family protein [Myroides marinus]|uniref:SMI1/KNR4 family protein n=1 Tax=Myroides marinus TaxID=703342 RepID=UPI002577B917|nr:SMI1/KNR4 family protein [Myroides marinus]MDM1363212.1 SMI1/KNR4 family protein [Myroides marinus]
MNTQINRIKDKLATIKEYDKDYNVFGADSHEYTIGKVVSEQEIKDFEQTYNINLPEAYVAFLTQIGNANISEEAYANSAAGPYYGIYPLGEGLDDLGVEDVERFTSYPCLLRLDMTEEQWIALSESTREEGISDEVYYERMGNLFGGLLPIGTQGCAITTCLILTGEYKGRIVYLNEDYQPIFAHEDSFLDWYERWLDEIISGDLVSDNAGWFGYSIGGSSESLWESYKHTSQEAQQLTFLEGLLKKKELTSQLIEEIIQEIPKATELVKESLLTILSKNAFDKAIPFLEEQANTNLLHVLQMIHWYGKDKAYWLPLLKAKNKEVMDPETYRFYSYVLVSATSDFGPLLTVGLASDNAENRGQAIYTLGQFNNKQQYVSSFINGLRDSNERVVLNTLQALSTVLDEQLLPVYKEVYQKYKESSEDNYIVTNLKHRLGELGMEIEDLN